MSSVKCRPAPTRLEHQPFSTPLALRQGQGCSFSAWVRSSRPLIADELDKSKTAADGLKPNGLSITTELVHSDGPGQGRITFQHQPIKTAGEMGQSDGPMGRFLPNQGGQQHSAE